MKLKISILFLLISCFVYSQNKDLLYREGASTGVVNEIGLKVPWTGVQSRPTALSQFTNDLNTFVKIDGSNLSTSFNNTVNVGNGLYGDIAMRLMGSSGLNANTIAYNMLQFNQPNAVEKFDGSAWSSISYNADLFNGSYHNSTQMVIPSGTQKVRFTWNSFGYRFFSTLVLSGTWADNTATYKVQRSADGNTWVDIMSNNTPQSGWPGFNYLHQLAQTTGTETRLRIEISFTWGGSNSVSLNAIALLGAYGGFNPLYTWDSNRNISAYGTISASDATASTHLMNRQSSDARYLGLSATAANTVLFNSQLPSYYLNYNNLTNKPTIPSAQVNSDWNATSGVAQILNLPSTFTPSSHLHSGGDITSGTLSDTRLSSNVALKNIDNNFTTQTIGSYGLYALRLNTANGAKPILATGTNQTYIYNTDAAGSIRFRNAADNSTIASLNNLGDFAARDFNANRYDGTGVYYFAGLTDRYLYYNGSNYVFNGADLNMSGSGIWNLKQATNSTEAVRYSQISNAVTNGQIGYGGGANNIVSNSDFKWIENANYKALGAVYGETFTPVNVPFEVKGNINTYYPVVFRIESSTTFQPYLLGQTANSTFQNGFYKVKIGQSSVHRDNVTPTVYWDGASILEMDFKLSHWGNFSQFQGLTYKYIQNTRQLFANIQDNSYNNGSHTFVVWCKGSTAYTVSGYNVKITIDAIGDGVQGASPLTNNGNTYNATTTLSLYDNAVYNSLRNVAPNFISTTTTGQPYATSSTVLNTNLNSDLLDGQHGSYYQNASNLTTGTLADARLSSNVPLKNGANTFSGTNYLPTNTYIAADPAAFDYAADAIYVEKNDYRVRSASFQSIINATQANDTFAITAASPVFNISSNLVTTVDIGIYTAVSIGNVEIRLPSTAVYEDNQIISITTDRKMQMAQGNSLRIANSSGTVLIEIFNDFLDLISHPYEFKGGDVSIGVINLQIQYSKKRNKWRIISFNEYDY